MKVVLRGQNQDVLGSARWEPATSQNLAGSRPPKSPRSVFAQERNRNMKILVMLFTEVGELLVSKVVELVGHIELNWWTGIHHFISCRFHKGSRFSQNHFEMCDNEPSTKSLQYAVIQVCADVEVIPQGPPEGDHMANGRVEMAVREVKRQCRTLRISAEQNTTVRIADDSPLLRWTS